MLMISADILGERARLTPHRKALVAIPTRQSWTYGELNERAVCCARLWLEICCLKKGDRVGILAHNRVEFVEAFCAAGKSGLILVPLNTRLTTHELEFIIRDSGISALMYAGDFAPVIGELRRCEAVKHWIALDEPNDPDDGSYAVMTSSLSPSQWTSEYCHPEDVYCLLYTSGTTGKPKGVMLPHRMIAWNAYNTVISWQLREDDVAPVFTPMYHAGGLNVFLTPLFAIGGRVVLHSRFDAAEVWRAVEAEKATVIFGVPTIFKMLLEAPEFERADVSHVRWCISGGAPLPLYLIEAYRRRGIVFKQGYGLTEVGVNCFSMTVEDSMRKAGSIGKPLMFTEARLVDPQGRDVETGEIGELLLRGPHVSKGYWDNPQATAESLDSEGWFHTADSARRDDEGFFYIAGRQKDMIISGGVNIYPAELEGELLRHPDVRDAAVVGVSHPTWGEVGVAFVVVQEDRKISSEELSRYLTGRVAKFKVPQDFIFVESLPRTPYGKVLKGELRDQYLEARKEDS